MNSLIWTIDEKTNNLLDGCGKEIATIIDPSSANLLAAAPLMLTALKGALPSMEVLMEVIKIAEGQQSRKAIQSQVEGLSLAIDCVKAVIERAEK